MNDAVITKGLSKRYGARWAVCPTDLRIRKGELFGLLGVNGAGKTSLIRMLCGLCEPSGGQATVLSFDIARDMTKIKKHLAVSPQETAIAPRLTVQENLDFFAALYYKDKEEATRRVVEVVRLFSLEQVLDQRGSTLSGGWGRRLSIAIALLPAPAVLFLDEPTLGLDVLSRRALWKVIEGLRGKCTLVLTSHYLEEIEALCDRVAMMAAGEIRFVGSVAEAKAETGQARFEDAFVSIMERGASV